MLRAGLFVILIILGSNLDLRAQSSWELVYENDELGEPISGDIESLIQAVRDGLPVRVGWQSKRHPNSDRWVEHVADSKFLTILSGNIVFAQIDGIYGQTPDFESKKILLKENLTWVMIAGSNGTSDSYMRNMLNGEIMGHKQSPRGFKWWIPKN